MPSILHLGHSPKALGYPASLVTTDVGTFDPDLDSFAFRRSRPNNGNLPVGLSLPFTSPRFAPADDLWLSFRVHYTMPGAPALNSPRPHQIVFHDPAPNLSTGLRLMDGDNNFIRLVFMGSGGVTNAATISLAAIFTGTRWIDINVARVGNDRTVTLYVDGAVFYTQTVTVVGAAGIVGVSGVWPNVPTTTALPISVSMAHFAVTDGISTIGRRWARFRPLAQGHANEWQGTVSDLVDQNPLTVQRAPTPGLRTAFTVEPAFTGAPAGALEGAVMVAQRRGAPGLRVTPYQRVAGVNYDGSPIPQSSWFSEAAVQELPLRPDDAAPWTVARMEATEFGLLSVAPA